MNNTMDKLICKCLICGDVFTCDTEPKIEINGCEIVICCSCEDDILVKLLTSRGIGIKLDGGEVVTLDVGGVMPNQLILADGYEIREI